MIEASGRRADFGCEKHTDPGSGQFLIARPGLLLERKQDSAVVWNEPCRMPVVEPPLATNTNKVGDGGGRHLQHQRIRFSDSDRSITRTLQGGVDVADGRPGGLWL